MAPSNSDPKKKKKREISKNQKFMVTLPRQNYLYLKVLIPKYGRSESEVIIHLINDFLENHRNELERNICREKLKMLEDKLASVERKLFEDELEEYDFEL